LVRSQLSQSASSGFPRGMLANVLPDLPAQELVEVDHAVFHG
jgi:hypothetical protein